MKYLRNLAEFGPRDCLRLLKSNLRNSIGGLEPLKIIFYAVTAHTHKQRTDTDAAASPQGVYECIPTHYVMRNKT